ncbi:hypothetical protein Dimus_035693, partial [Dionaea muscipula]
MSEVGERVRLGDGGDGNFSRWLGKAFLVVKRAARSSAAPSSPSSVWSSNER